MNIFWGRGAFFCLPQLPSELGIPESALDATQNITKYHRILKTVNNTKLILFTSKNEYLCQGEFMKKEYLSILRCNKKYS